MVTAEAISSRSIGIGVLDPNQQADSFHYKCYLTTDVSDSVQVLSLNDTKNNSPYSAVKGLSPYTNYTATCLVLKDGVDQCYTGIAATQTSTDSKLLLFLDIQAMYTAYCTVSIRQALIISHQALIIFLYPNRTHCTSSFKVTFHLCMQQSTSQCHCTFFSLSVRTHCTSPRSVHSLNLLPLLHNDVGLSSQGAAEW